MQSKSLTLAAIAAFGLSTSAFGNEPEPKDFSAGEHETIAGRALESNGHCTYPGHVVRVSAYEHFEDSYVYWRTQAIDNFYYYAKVKVDDDRLLNAAFHSLAGPTRVEIVTDRACNHGGSERFAGYITVLRLNP